jgi:two-component system chemotaxis sensor kinase CheA
LAADDDRFRLMFYEEARELLIKLEEGLVELERRQGDRAHLDSTFRAAHSIKGAAGMVGLGALAEFTHGIEAVLDRIRSGRLAVDSDIITTLLEARDHLAAMVEAEAAGSPIAASAELNQRLAALLRDPSQPPPAPPPTPTPPPASTPTPTPPPPPTPTPTPPPAAGPTASALPLEPESGPPPKPARRSRKSAGERPDGEARSRRRTPRSRKEAAPPPPVADEPVGWAAAGAAASAAAEESAGRALYRITLKPGPDTLRRGVNPLGVLDELRDLGEARVSTDPALVPPLDEIDAERCYLVWTIELESDAPPERLDDVFLFVAMDSTVTIERQTPDGSLLSHPPPPTLAVSPVASARATPPEPRPAPPQPQPQAAPTAAAKAPSSQAAPGPATAPAPSPAPVPPAPQAPAAAKAPARAPLAAASTSAPRTVARIRVDSGQLDDLVGLAGELAVLSDNLQTLRDLPGAQPWVHTLEALERVSRQVRDTTLDLRMVPVDELFSRFPRVVRDLADRSGKEIELRIIGQETRLDRTIVERLSEPMIHLIRNGVDHALESPQERLAAGKPRVGRITLMAGHEGDRVAIRVSDDGRGLDREKIVRKGIKQGLVPIGTSPDDPRVDTLIFEPGFSTRDQVSELSGRGVGLDVVRDAVRGLRGSIAVESTPGKGTSFIFRLPLTLALIDGLLVESAGSRYVVPLAQVEECVSLNGSKPALSRGRPCVAVRGELVPMVPLRKLFQATDDPPSRQELLLTRHAGQRVGVAVDKLLGRVQAVIQALGEGLVGLNRFSGATILGDGSVSLILDLAALVTESRAGENHTAPPANGRAEGF